jgi:GntR family transcriptional regulator
VLTITVDRGIDRPVYEQVADQIRQLATAGALPASTPLPSVRSLASDLGVSLNTVARAYRLLEGEGFLIIRDRAGVSVAAPAKEPDPSVLAALTAQLRATLARLRQAGVTVPDLMEIIEYEVVGIGGSGR